MSNNNNNQEEKEEKEEDTEEKGPEVMVKIPPPPPPPEAYRKGPAEEGKPVPKPLPNGHHCQPMNRSIFPCFTVSPAAERIRFILGEEDDGPAPPQLFTELDELLSVDGQEMEWKETARWGPQFQTWGDFDLKILRCWETFSIGFHLIIPKMCYSWLWEAHATV